MKFKSCTRCKEIYPDIIEYFTVSYGKLTNTCRFCKRKYNQNKKRRETWMKNKGLNIDFFCKRCGIKFGGKIKDAKRHIDFHDYCEECGDFLKKNI